MEWTGGMDAQRVHGLVSSTGIFTDRKSGQQFEIGDIAIFTDWMEGQWCGDGHNGGRVDRGHDDESLDRVEDLPHRQHGGASQASSVWACAKANWRQMGLATSLTKE